MCKLLTIFVATLLLGTAAVHCETKSSRDKKAAATNSPAVTPPLGDTLVTGDRLNYSVAEDPKGVSDTYLVSPRGEVAFEVSRASGEFININVKNKTIVQVKEELKKQLDEKYYQNATVTLKMLDRAVRGGKIWLSGSVRNSSLDLLPGEERKIFEVILQAGATEFANLKKVKLNRVDPVTGKLEVIIIDVNAIKKDPTKDFLLRDGDRLEVPEKHLVF